MISKNDFLKKYKIASSVFESSNIDWEVLIRIYTDYEKHIEDFEGTAEKITKKLRKCKKIHSIKYRIKEPEHLIEKIIRKNIENNERQINENNYLLEIRDLIGVRVIHLFKKDCKDIVDYIKNTFLHKNTEINIREGDSKILYLELGFLEEEIKPHTRNYRSIHCEINEIGISKLIKELPIEIQVRTIFEEGWSEIDHTIRYPINDGSNITSLYLDLFNRFSGAIDEMGNFLGVLQEQEANWKNTKNEVEELKKKLSNDSRFSVKEKTDVFKTLDSILYTSPYVRNFNTSIGQLDTSYLSESLEGFSQTMTHVMKVLPDTSYLSDSLRGISLPITHIAKDNSYFLNSTKPVVDVFSQTHVQTGRICEECGKTFQNDLISYSNFCQNCRKNSRLML